MTQVYFDFASPVEMQPRRVGTVYAGARSGIWENELTEFPIAMGDIQPARERPADQHPSPKINLENAFIEIDGKRYEIIELLARLAREHEQPVKSSL